MEASINIKLCTEANQDYKRTVPEPQVFAHPTQIWSMDNGSQHQISNYALKQIKITKEQFENHNFLHIQTRYGQWTMEASIKYQTMHQSKSRLQKNSSGTTTSV
ncbi:Uncharacterized protein Fot_03391 [Forsythia ovata]|uniref:Uncharacterized protein n=1 Tax=Forsythia ovata TaxID=205694 RepID=A0ABD1X9N5_9LAMI